jgi:hypothetical protein
MVIPVSKLQPPSQPNSYYSFYKSTQKLNYFSMAAYTQSLCIAY